MRCVSKQVCELPGHSHIKGKGSKGKEGKGREEKGRGGKGRKGREGEGREGKGRAGRGQEGDAKGGSRTHHGLHAKVDVGPPRLACDLHPIGEGGERAVRPARAAVLGNVLVEIFRAIVDRAARAVVDVAPVFRD